MRAARYVPTRWWLDREFLGLVGDTQRALLCLWSAPETPTSGITTVSAWTIADRLRISSKQAASRLAELEQAGFVSLDSEASLIWLHGYVETQLGGLPTSNPKWVAATVSAVNMLPDTALTRRFRLHYGLPDRVSIPHGHPTDTVADTRSSSFPPTPSPGVQDGEVQP